MTDDWNQCRGDSETRSSRRNLAWSAEAFGEGGYEEFTPSPEQLADMLLNSFRKRPETLAAFPTSICALAEKMHVSRARARRVVTALETGGLKRRGVRNAAEWCFDE